MLKDGYLKSLYYINYYQNKQWCQSEERIKERQLANLKALLVHAYEQTEYYKKIFDDAWFNPYKFKDFDELTSLPLLTKEIIRKNINKMLAKNIKKEELFEDSTGGSTGVPLVFYRDKECLFKRKAQELFFDRWIGCDIGDKIALFVAPRHYPGGLKGIKQRFRNATCERILAFNPYKTNEEYMEWFYQQLIKFKPKIIKCFPNSLSIFAQFLKERGYKGIKVKAISCTGENLYSNQRQLFKEVFQCPIFEKYACFEHGVISCECSKHKGQHIFTDGVYLEFLNNDKPAKPGEIADIIVTDLFNYGMPFIRYKIGDKGIYTKHKCSCGSHLPMIEKILGRDRDILISSNGEKKPGYLFVEVINKNRIPGQFQIIQYSYKEVEVKIVPTAEFNKQHENIIRKNFQKLLGHNINIIFRYVEEIPREPSGKYAYVKSEISH